jgi:GNAT superfamily N-acetyltransferase
MIPHISVQSVVDDLARDPLRNIVLLRHLLAYPEHSRIHRVSDATGAATLVVLDASVSPCDRQAYPHAAVAALISSDHPDLTAQLMRHLPRGVGIVFKLSRDADLAAVESQFAVKRRTAVVSFTSAGPFEQSPDVQMTTAPSDATFRLFASQGHDRAWLEPPLRNGTAFACVLERGGDALSACFAFENYGPVWEVGGVITAPSHRGRGLGAQIVCTVLAELTGRGLTPRYQVDADNAASIALARSVGLAPFLTIAHYAHEC